MPYSDTTVVMHVHVSTDAVDNLADSVVESCCQPCRGKDFARNGEILSRRGSSLLKNLPRTERRPA